MIAVLTVLPVVDVPVIKYELAAGPNVLGVKVTVTFVVSAAVVAVDVEGAVGLA